MRSFASRPPAKPPVPWGLTEREAPWAEPETIASGKNASTENFPVGSFLLRADIRPHVHAFYLFARAADDIADNPLLDPAVKIEQLEALGHALTRGERGRKPKPVPACVAPLKASLALTGVPPQHALDLLTAFKRDAVQTRYLTWNDLMDYCRFSASPVGRHVLALHGLGEALWPANDALCSALQVINHVQDCADDYREVDRVYIPLDLFTVCGSDPANLSGEACTPALRSALDATLELTAQLVKEARRFPGLIPDRRLRAEVSVIVTLAEELVRLLRVRDPLCDSVKLGPFRMLWAVAKGLVRGIGGGSTSKNLSSTPD